MWLYLFSLKSHDITFLPPTQVTSELSLLLFFSDLTESLPLNNERLFIAALSTNHNQHGV